MASNVSGRKQSGDADDLGDLQEFTDEAITDPAELRLLQQQCRRPGEPTITRYVMLAGGILMVFLLGMVVGHFFFP